MICGNLHVILQFYSLIFFPQFIEDFFNEKRQSFKVGRKPCSYAIQVSQVRVSSQMCVNIEII